MTIPITYAIKQSSCIVIKSNGYSSEVKQLLICAKRVQSMTEVTKVLKSITKLDYNVSFSKGRKNNIRKILK